jgi:hypothetical protein
MPPLDFLNVRLSHFQAHNLKEPPDITLPIKYGLCRIDLVASFPMPWFFEELIGYMSG